MTFRIGKAEVRLSLGVLPLFAALIVAGEGETLALSLLALLLHECAHAIAAHNLGFSLRRLSVYPFGAVMHIEPLYGVPQGEWIVALAGPLCSFAAASAVRLLAHLVGDGSDALDPFVHTNLAIALLNLLPAYPLDGGRIARSLLLRVMEERAARRTALAFSAVISALLFGAGILAALHGIPAWTLLLIAPYLCVSAWIEWKQVRPCAIAHVLERRAARKAGAPLRAQTVLIDADATIGEAMQTLSHRCFTILRIRTRDGTFETDEDALLDAASRFGCNAALKDVFLH